MEVSQKGGWGVCRPFHMLVPRMICLSVIVLAGLTGGLSRAEGSSSAPRLHAKHWGLFGGNHGKMDLDVTTYDLPIHPDGWAFSRFGDPETKQDWWNQVRQLRRDGCYQLPILGLRGSYAERVEQLERMFAADDGVMTYPEDLVGVALGHEVTPQSDPLDNRLYDYIKSRWPALQVYKFYSGPVKPYSGLATGRPERCDGYLYDIYGGDADSFRRTVQKFVVTGKPVVILIWASEPGWDGYFKGDLVGAFEGTDFTPDAPARQNDVQDGLIRRAPNSDLEQYFWHASGTLREFGLPVLLFGVAGAGNVNQWYYGNSSPNLLYIRENMAFRLRDEMRRSASTGPQPSADYSRGVGVEVKSRDGKTVFDYGLQQSAWRSGMKAMPHRILPGPFVDKFLPDDVYIGLRTIDHATIHGFTRLLHTVHPEGHLVTRDESGCPGEVDLVYRFYSEDGLLGDLGVEVTGAVNPNAGGVNSVALSTDGLLWSAAVRSVPGEDGMETLRIQAPKDWPMVGEFYVRVRMAYESSLPGRPANTLEQVKVDAVWNEPAFTETTPIRRAGTFADGGFYAVGGAWGGSLAHRRVSLDADINDWLRAEKAKGHLTVVELEGGRGKNASEKLAQWLSRTDLGRIDLLHVGEEVAYNAGSWLNPLYDLVKQADPELPVYVWYSSPLGPGGAKADGFWYDRYGAGYTPFREVVRQYVSTGKPFGMCVDASLYSSLEAAREQVMVCKEFDLPVYYFGANSGSGSANNWRWGRESSAILAPGRNFAFSALEFQRRSRPPWSLTAGDFLWGDVIGLTGNYDGQVDYEWLGLGDSTVYGFKHLMIKDGMVRSTGTREVALDYQFRSSLPINTPRFELDSGAEGVVPKVELSRSGAPGEWRELNPNEVGAYLLGDTQKEFRLRLTFADEKIAFAKGRIVGDLAVPDDKAISLYPDYYHGWQGKIRYKQSLSEGLWQALGCITGREDLEPGRVLAMRGKSGCSAGVEVIQKFTSERPLKDIIVRLRGSHNGRSLGGSTSLGVSLDDEHVLVEGEAEGTTDRNGNWSGVHTANLSEIASFTGVREFYVHMRQRNGSGVRGSISSHLDTLEIEASFAD